jgi:hypothetical protein
MAALLSSCVFDLPACGARRRPSVNADRACDFIIPPIYKPVVGL